MSDLRTNNVRGYLAEFLVARAVGAHGTRAEWDPWDVAAPDGTKIEVKASGFLQAWTQQKLSVPTFRVAPAYSWDASTGTSSKQQTYNADVYVFCLHTATSHDEYDPLETSQWRFYVAGRSAIEARGGQQMSLTTLARLTGEPVTYPALKRRHPRCLDQRAHIIRVPACGLMTKRSCFATARRIRSHLVWS